jgi:hypothetical protein
VLPSDEASADISRWLGEIRAALPAGRRRL